VSTLGLRLLAVHDALTKASLPHAIGGAIALGYCTSEPRGTRDLDVNVFVAPERARDVLGALPAEVSVSARDVKALMLDGQVRVWWEDTPVDLFLNVLSFHREVAKSVRHVPFMDRAIPVLGCSALAVFKAMFDRTRDWADIEAMIERSAIDLDQTVRWIRELDGPDSARARRLISLSNAASC
jgi:hypothetical protein